MNTITPPETPPPPQFDPIAIISQFKHRNRMIPSACLVPNVTLNFNAAFVAGALISLYENFLRHVPESGQVAFEAAFLKLFDVMFKHKEECFINTEDLDLGNQS